MIGWQQSAKSHGSSQTKSKEDNSLFALELNASFNQTNRLHKNVLSSLIEKALSFFCFCFTKTVQHYSEYFLYTQQCLHAVLVSIYLWKSKWKGSAGFFYIYSLKKKKNTHNKAYMIFLLETLDRNTTCTCNFIEITKNNYKHNYQWKLHFVMFLF